MAAQVSHRQRLETVLAGEIPDRAPVALWRHFPVDDQSPDALARAVANFQHTFDFDLIKVTPASSYCLRDWGVQDRWAGNPEGTRENTMRVIRRPEDWELLPVLDPRQGFLSEQLTTLRLLVDEFGTRTPILMTIFSPLSQAKNLAGGELLLTHLRQYPDSVLAGLETIAETTQRFIDMISGSGIAGIFYAVQHAQYRLLSIQEFETFGKDIDLRVMEPARHLWLNLLHLHGETVMFDQGLKYPAAVINWHDRESGPTLADAQSVYDGVVCGGLRQWDTMVMGTPEQVTAEAVDALLSTSGRRFILGTGCVLPITAPYGNIVAARQAVEPK